MKVDFYKAHSKALKKLEKILFPPLTRFQRKNVWVWISPAAELLLVGPRLVEYRKGYMTYRAKYAKTYRKWLRGMGYEKLRPL